MKWRKKPNDRISSVEEKSPAGEKIGVLSEVADDHARNPRNHGPLADFTGHAWITGPCGDTMEFWLAVHE